VADRTNRRLTQNDARAIRAAYADIHRPTLKWLGQRYGVSAVTIHNIIHEKIYKERAPA